MSREIIMHYWKKLHWSSQQNPVVEEWWTLSGESEGTTLDRVDGPAHVMYHDRGKDELWYKNGYIHRDGDEPAELSEWKFYTYEDGSMVPTPRRRVRSVWYRNGLKHRDVGPAVTITNFIRDKEVSDHSAREWWLNGCKQKEARKCQCETPERGVAIQVYKRRRCETDENNFRALGLQYIPPADSSCD